MPKAKEQKLCQSGSGAKTNGGTFAPGGDAKYKSALIARVIDGDPSKAESDAEAKRLRGLGYSDEYIANDAAGCITATRAKAILKARNWTRFLTKRQDTLKTKADAAKARETAKKAKAAAKKAAKPAKKASGSTRKASAMTVEAPAAGPSEASEEGADEISA